PSAVLCVTIPSARFLMSVFFLLTPPPPTSTLFPYTTLFRICRGAVSRVLRADRRDVLDHSARLHARVGRRDVLRVRRHVRRAGRDRKSTRLNSSHRTISYAVFCLKKKTEHIS